MAGRNGHDGQELPNTGGEIPQAPDARLPALRVVQERFADHRESLEHLFKEDDSFHELCFDYAECVKSEERFAAAGPKGQALHKEYVALKLSLERAMLRYIEGSEGGCGDPQAP